MTNNIRKIKQDLRAYAKRCKDVHYTESLVITFLITGMLFTTSNLFSAPTNTSIENQRQTISTSIKTIHQQVKATRKENDKLLKNTNLELIQLMEQGDHVVKSPWSSWQYGINYFNNNWNGTYKGRGDKKAKYPYEGIFQRSQNIYERAISPDSSNYGMLSRNRRPNFASGSAAGYGIASVKPVKEPIVPFEVNAGIRPRSINKSAIRIADKTAVTPTLPEAISFTPPKPVISVPKDPFTPNPPTFSVILGADCNEGCNSGDWRTTHTNGGITTPRQTTRSGFLTSTTDNKSKQNMDVWLHYTWRDAHGDDGSLATGTPAEQSYAFKMYKETDTATLPTPGSGNTYYFNSYNFGETKEFSSGVMASQDFYEGRSPIDRNKQYFFIGGSRFWEIDNYPTVGDPKNPSGIYEFPNGKTVNLGGILTLGLVSQQNASEIRNSGIITDKEENQEEYIQNISQKYDTDLTFNADGRITGENHVAEGTGHYLKIYGPASSVYYVKKSEDGYVGYKVGIAQVQENGGKDRDTNTAETGWYQGGENQKLTNNTGATIDFRGERSIGMYDYLPDHTSWSIMTNSGNIFLSGKESYGMKLAARTASRAEMVNKGIIELRVNPDGNKKDKADNSAAMALMEDESVRNKVNLDRGKAVNESTGTIKLSGVQNSLGMFVNVDSNMTNKGKIQIDSDIAKAETNQPMNVAMRADYGTGKGGSTTVGSNAEVINDANGEISLKGNFAIGQLARLSTATNKTGGKIITNDDIKNSVGMSTLGGALNNDGEITLKGSGVSNNIGAFLNSYKLSTTTYNPKGKLGANSRITVSGDSSTGVLINGSSTGTTASLEYGGTVTATGNGVSGMTIGDNNTGKAEVTAKNDGTVTVNGGNASTSAGVYEYMDGKNKVRKGSYGIVVSKNSSLVSHGGKNVNVDVNVKGSESIGLYSGENATLEVGNHTVKAYDGAVNYDADKGKITLKGTGTATTGQKSLLFYLGENGTGKVSIDGTMTATIEGGTTPNTRGNAFYYVGNGGDFGKTQIEDWAKNNFGNGSKTTLGNLTLNMNKGSRLFIAQNVGMNLSDTTGDAVSKATGAHINGTDYKTFMLYLSKLTINQNVNLDDANDAYNQLEISNSSITNSNTKTITGTKASQVAMAQENNSRLYSRNKVTLSNEGTINLSGAGSTGMYTKFGELYNKATGVMTIGDKSTAIYGTEDSLLENAGKITIGSNSTGLYSEGSKSQAIKNTGTIESAGNDSVAMSYKPDASLSPGVTLENAGKITMTGDRNTAIYATGTPGYTAKNSGTVTLGNSAAISSPNVGLYTDHNTVTLENTGTISSGNNTIGIYGHNVNNAGNLNIGNAAVGIYSQSGNVNLTGGTITTGTDEAVGVYTVGSGQTVTNSGTAFNIGNNSFGFVNVGTGNKITSSISNVGLGNNNVYMYSSDTKGTVTNATNITSTGEQNYGIYSAGTVTNTGNINLSSGKGSVAIYSIKGGTATNYGTITVGESDVPSSLYSIGMGAGYTTTDTGNIVNRGTINVNGKHSIGMYASGAGSTATNDGNIVLNASNTTGIYADNGATVINNKSITTGSGTYTNTVGVYLGKDSKLINNKGATIDINAKNGVGVYLKGGTVANYGTMRVNGSTRDEDTIYEFTVPSTGKGVGGSKY
ncbi:autotransporter beta-domain protein [Leptotrichia trevisanii]|uniref:autotransporter-associated N-terminal domain-containing protein n=1 Tax=Leptotrichia trevisanii TaxID=109328 RepID=UPI00118A258A|nr:autotransporter beta-domain protein [Leptotrichia trevisanii]